MSSYFCSRGYGRSLVISNHVMLMFIRYFDDMYVALPLVVLCERRLHETSTYLGLKVVYELFRKGLIWIHMFHAMVRFILILLL